MKKAETQQVILGAAKKLFITNGYKGTTTVQIAKEAGISEMTLFRHFTSKEEIFLAVIHPLVSFLDNLDVNVQGGMRKAIRDLMQNRNDLEVFLQNALYPLLERFEQKDGKPTDPSHI